MRRLSALLKRAKLALQREGPTSAIKRWLTFLGGYLFKYERFDLHEHSLERVNEADYLPKVSEFVAKVFSSEEEVEKALKEGLDFSSELERVKDWLRKGVKVICIFVGGELAYRGYVILTEEGANLQPPFKVDYLNEAAFGGAWTNPKYRGKGLMTYAHFKKLEVAKKAGKSLARSAVNKSNTPAQRADMKFNPKKYAELRHLRILGFEWWKEIPLN